MMTFWSFAFQFCLAVLAILLGIYMPGRLILRAVKVELNSLEHLAASLVGGTGLLVLIYWSLSMLRFPAGLWFYLLICTALEVYFSMREWQKNKNTIPDPGAPLPETLLTHWPLWLLMLAGMIAQARFTVLTGWQGSEGVSLLAWHACDAPWHIFNLYQLAHRFPPEMPGFAGQTLQNYHMFSDLLWGAILRLVPVDPWHCYFRIAPLFYSGLLSLTTFVTARRWSGKIPVAYLAVAITLFCTNFGYVMPLLFGAHNYFIWDSIFWVQPPMSMIFNPGVSSSFALFMMGLWALIQWTRRKNAGGFLVLLTLYWGVLPGFKVYPGVLVVAALLVSGGILLCFQRNYKQLVALAALLPLCLFVFLPFNLNAPSLIRFLPGFNLGTMLVAPDRMALMTSTELKVLFVQKPWLVFMIMAGLALLFLIGNLGVRVIGLLSLVRTLLTPRRADPVLMFIAVVICGAFAAPLLFVQQGVPWNTIQFFYYAVLISALPAAEQFWLWIQRYSLSRRYFFVTALFLLGLPGAVQSWIAVDFCYQSEEQVYAGLKWLQAQAKKDEVILRPLPDALMTDEGYQYWQRSQVRGRMTSLQEWRAEAEVIAGRTGSGRQEAAETDDTRTAKSKPDEDVEVDEINSVQTKSKKCLSDKIKKTDNLPALERTDTALVASLVLKNTYLEGTVSAQIMGFPVEQRVQAVRRFYQSYDVVQAREFLEKEGIVYVILFRGQKLPFNPDGVPLKTIFANESMTIYKYIFPEGW